MDKLKFYKYASGGLLLLNLAMLAFFVLTKPPHHGHGPNNDIRAEVAKILSLDKAQESSFNKSAHDHNEKLRSIVKQQKDLLLPYFESVTNASEGSGVSANLAKFQQLEREKLEVTHQHLSDLKNLLREDQLPHFKEFMNLFIERVVNKNKKNPPPPKH